LITWSVWQSGQRRMSFLLACFKAILLFHATTQFQGLPYYYSYYQENGRPMNGSLWKKWLHGRKKKRRSQSVEMVENIHSTNGTLVVDDTNTETESENRSE
jgi:hypothetical protein